MTLERLNIFCNQVASVEPQIISISEFFRLSNLEGINIYDLQQFIATSNLDKKILNSDNSEDNKKKKFRLSSIFVFLSSLTTSNVGGRLLLSREGKPKCSFLQIMCFISNTSYSMFQNISLSLWMNAILWS